MTQNPNPTVTTTSARHSLDLWLTMWNSDGDLARQICSDDFRIHFAVTEPDGSTPADDIRSAEDFAQYLDWWHGQNPETVFTRIADAIDGEHGRLLWDVEADGQRAGGVDVFDFDADGRVRRVWSVGGQRSMLS
ncbi:nuclear transport factor 2 family protein [Kineosporia rhizophila]|uniref:nuclear transport factor 2 family protein n=1 Tax=Kineosporia rhizophila TaxID=84633 RepID=UPI000A89C624|nr:nuclear transport factor 2 family protein [Kineosporia rhizophila]MCE0536157.1 nuclear transport factor 2 family protein [Kineosporia rhizophila]